MTTGTLDGIVAGMDELEQKYQALVERISGYPMSEAAREQILAEVDHLARQDATKYLTAPRAVVQSFVNCVYGQLTRQIYA